MDIFQVHANSFADFSEYKILYGKAYRTASRGYLEWGTQGQQIKLQFEADRKAPIRRRRGLTQYLYPAIPDREGTCELLIVDGRSDDEQKAKLPNKKLTSPNRDRRPTPQFRLPVPGRAG
jgi:hypothetical protein